MYFVHVTILGTYYRLQSLDGDGWTPKTVYVLSPQNRPRRDRLRPGYDKKPCSSTAGFG